VKHDRAQRLTAKRTLKYDPVCFTGLQARAIASGFARAALEGGYEILACAILGDHVHLIVARIDRPISQVVAHLKGRASQELREEGLHPFDEFADAAGNFPSVWAGRYWKVFVDNDEHLDKAIEYVEKNPLKEGKRKQKWKLTIARGTRHEESRDRSAAKSHRDAGASGSSTSARGKPRG
jgi:REP element-mobilizing transposase RayT